MKSNRKLSRGMQSKVDAITSVIEKVSYMPKDEWLKKKTRASRILTYRNIFVHICHHDIGLTKTELGGLIDIDHTTIYHAINNVNNWIEFPNVYTYETAVFKEIGLEYSAVKGDNEYIDLQGNKWIKQ